MALSGVRISWLTLARKSDFKRARAFGLAARRFEFLLDLLPMRHVAQKRAIFRFLVRTLAGAEPAQSQKDRDRAALARLTDDLASVIEQARDAIGLQPLEIVLRLRLAFWREQNGEGLARRRRFWS